jgi:hypothetical protein
MGIKGQKAWNKGQVTQIEKICPICKQKWYATFRNKRKLTCSKECKKVYLRQRMQQVYEDENVKNKLRQSMYEQYNNGTRDRFEITKKANEEMCRRGKEKFKTNPTRRISKRGYWMIYVPEKGWIKEHQYIWEQKHSQMNKGQVLHHIDGNPLNNKLSNLILLNSHSDHMKLHWQLKKQNENIKPTSV